MVTYGPWTQDPDYTAAVGTNYSEADQEASAQHVIDGARPPGSQSEIDAVVTASVGAWNGTATIPTLGGPLSTWVDFKGGLTGPWSTVYTATRNYGLLAFSAYTNQANVWTPTVPADAIGYEYETGNRSTVVAAELDLGSKAYNLDTSVNGAASGSWSTDIRAVTGVNFASETTPPNVGPDTTTAWDHNTTGALLLNLPPAPHQTTRIDTVDLTPHLFGPPEAGYVVLIHDVIGSATLGNLSADETGYTIGSNLFVPGQGVVYTLRPPRYRLIYGTPTTVGYSRIVQRGSDGYGMTGGRRAFGGRTVQATNRRGAPIR